MNTKRINGLELERMLRNGLANLRSLEDEVNKLNVFPVADGDTGTNMVLTLENGIRFAQSRPEVGAYLKMLSEGMLLGARGNSGVILSQLFKGIFLELQKTGIVNPAEMRNAFIRGYITAYSSVIKPAEGTILTVAREGIEHIKSQVGRSTTMETLLSMYVAEMRKSLSFTPDILPILKESGVVDSGAYGYILIVEGMLKYLYGDIIKDNPGSIQPMINREHPNAVIFNENSLFEDGYCMEFILQLMNNPNYNRNFRLNSFIDDLKLFGDSLVVVQDQKRVKVHIHTMRPAKVISLSQEYGEFASFKMENMQVQHNRVLKEKEENIQKKPLSVISVVNGKGMRDLFLELGCDNIIECEDTMNTSSQEFIDAFKRTNAEHLVVMPNNKNVFLSAQQAIQLYKGSNIHILPTESVAQAYCALAMDIPDSRDIPYRLSQMKLGMDGVATLFQTTASKDFSFEGPSCKAGDQIALLENNIVAVSHNAIDSIIIGISKIADIEDKENCIIFKGYDVTDDEVYELEEKLSQSFPELEVTFLDGGQKIHHFIIGVF